MNLIHRIPLLILLSYFTAVPASPQNCPLHIGTNIAGVVDWTTEMPFVDVMHQARMWYTQNSAWVDGGSNPFNTECIDSIPCDANGYPLRLPLDVPGEETTQVVSTIWADLSAWPEGRYVLLYDGTGDIRFWGDMTVVAENPGRMEVLFTRPAGGAGVAQLTIAQSDSADHIHNIRLLMPGTESTYVTRPFYQPWIEKLSSFSAVRFMDWGATNNWGHDDAWSCYDEDADSIPVPWSQRSSPSYYTWATPKGVPYETMIDLCNRLNADMWICVPHSASIDYITQLATLVRSTLDPAHTVYVEYSNETWNWMFGQTQWLYKFGCQYAGRSWPEGIVPYVQRCLDVWTEVFQGEEIRLVRVVGVQAAWQDVSNRIVFNLRPGSFDAFAPAAYFGLSEAADSALDALGASATTADIAWWARASMNVNEIPWLWAQKASIADSLHIPMLWYEGGQHLTPQPFGVEPSYATALLDIQRDTAIYNLYNTWFDTLTTFIPPDGNGLFMNFSFVSSRSARYGSWGILESITQNPSEIPAPKYTAIMERILDCQSDSGSFAVTTGWNLVSIPSLLSDYRTSTVFPTSISPAYAFDGAYLRADTLKNGTGYWLKFNHPHYIITAGVPIPYDTIGLRPTWNLIGTISQPVAAAGIVTTPSNILSSPFYRYTGSGYGVVDSLFPGSAYWIKTNSEGSMILSPAIVPPK